MSAQYPIGPFQCSRHEFNTILEQFPSLQKISQATKIVGPFDGKINSIYRIDIPNQESVIFRTRISKAFRYEPIIKEKILYPFLDGSIMDSTQDLGQKIKEIIATKAGSYCFKTKNPSIVPVQDLLYYYEPTNIVNSSNNPVDIYPPQAFPFLVSIKNYLPGRSLYDILAAIPETEQNSKAILATFEKCGEILAKLHSIRFNGFYDKITEIGDPSKKLEWKSLFSTQWQQNFTDASQYHAFHPLIPKIEQFFSDHKALVEDETEAVLFHNDYQSQNLLFLDNNEKSWNDLAKYTLSGVIDFDNWRIGPRAQDFVKMEYWTIKGNQLWLEAFYRGYNSIHPITKDFKLQIKIYKLLWFMLVYAFEMDKVKKQEINTTVDARFPAAEKYITEIENLLKS
jgi:aminoglycoside phosphotransferase (APT) family kinase protein